MPDQLVNLKDPDTGEIGSLPASQVPQALQQGFAQVSPEELAQHFKEEKYGTLGQQAITGAEAAASSLSFGASTGLERALGVPGEDIRARREVNPGVHTLGELGGIGVGLLTGQGEAAALEKVGAGAAKMLAGESALYKIGSTGARLAAENALFTGGDEVSKMFSGDPNQTIGTAMADIGLSGLIGAGTGGVFGAVSPLWKATIGGKVENFLNAVKEKSGGIEGKFSQPVADAIESSGIEFPPQVKAALTDDPHLQLTSKALEQSNSGTGIAHKETVDAAKKEITNYAAGALGADASKISAAADVSAADAGKNIGNALAQEIEAKINPLAKEFEELKGKVGNVEIEQPQMVKTKRTVVDPQDLTGVPKVVEEEVRAPGLMDQVGDKVSDLAGKEKWVLGDQTPGAKLFGFTMKNLKRVKDIDGLNGLIKRVGDMAQSMSKLEDRSPLNAASKIKSILRDTEASVIEKKLGEQGSELVERFRNVRKAWGEASDLIDDIRSHINVKSSASGFGKALREEAAIDGEKVLKGIAGSGNAAGLKLLQEKFPAAFQDFKEYHVSKLLDAASRGMPEGEISLKKLMSKIDNLSPEMREAVVTPEALQKLKAAEVLKNQLEKAPHNFSNTARTLDKMTEFIPGGAVAAAAMLAGHNPLLAFGLGGLMKVMTKDAPDAIRLGMLKFLGSNQQIESGAFKAMVDVARSALKGEAAVTKGAKSVLKSGAVDHYKDVSKNDRDKLDKRLMAFKENPERLMEIGGDIGHYMPDHASAAAATAANAVNYLNSLRPNTDKAMPLDADIPADPVKEAQFHRALDIAQQPLVVFNDIKEGTVTSEDLVTLQNVAPGLYARMREKLNNEIINHKASEGEIPYKTRLGLALFLGQPLDSTMTPMGIMSAQPKPIIAQAPQMPKPSATSMQKLSKMGAENATGSQLRQMGKVKHA